MKYAYAVFGGAAAGLLAGYLSACTPAQQAAAMQHSTTAAKFGACAMNVLAEVEAQRLHDIREEERRAEEEVAEINDAARKPSSSTSAEIEKVLKDGAAK